MNDSNIVITADSTCDLPQELIDKYDIKIIPLSILLGEKVYHDGVDIKPSDIYDFVEKTGELPKTAAVTPSEYNEVFNTAVRMFPDDATANLNAANSAMQRNDLTLAEKYLRKAGNSGEAILARGILAMLKGDRATAERLMKQAKELGIAVADQNLKELNSKQ